MFWVENVWYVCIVERTVGENYCWPSEEVVRGSLAEQSSKWKIPHPSNGCLCLLRQAHLWGWRSWVQLLVIVSDFLGQNSLYEIIFFALTLPFHSDRDFFLHYINKGGNWVTVTFLALLFLHAPILSLHLSLRRHLRDLYLSVLPHIQWIYTSFPWDSL